MQLPDLNDAERLVIECAMRGHEADLRVHPMPSLRAELIRELLVGPGEPLPGSLRIRGATITGSLDLRGTLGRPGSDCGSALELHECCFAEALTPCRTDERPPPTIDLRHARLAQLSICDCLVHLVALDGINVLGEANLSGLHATDSSQLCWLTARQAQIGGSLRLSRSKFALEPVTTSDATSESEYACDLRGSRIGGSVIALGGLRVRGGMSLPKQVGVDIWMPGARIERLNAKPSAALRAQGTRVEGSMVLRPDVCAGQLLAFHVHGPVDFFDLRLGGSLDMSGAVITADELQENFQLSAPYLRVGGSLLLGNWTHPKRPTSSRVARICGRIDMRRAVVTGHADISVRRLGPQAPAGEASPLMQHSELQAGLYLGECSADADLGAARLGSDLVVVTRPGDARITVRLPNARIQGNLHVHGHLAELNLAGAQVEGQVWGPVSTGNAIGRVVATECLIQGESHFVISEWITLRYADLGGKLDVELRGESSAGATLMATGLVAKRDVLVRNAFGSLELAQSQLGGDLSVRARVGALRLDLNGSDTRLRGNLYFSGQFNEIHLGGAVIEGQLKNGAGADYSAASIRAFESRIHGECRFVVRESLNLRGAELLGKVQAESRADATSGANCWASSLVARRSLHFAQIWEHLELGHVHVGGDVDLAEARTTRVDLRNSRIEGDARAPKHVFGEITLEGAHVSGSVRLDGSRLHVRKRAAGNTNPLIKLSDCSIAGDLYVHQLERSPRFGMFEEHIGLPPWTQAEPERLKFFRSALACYRDATLLEVHERLTDSSNADAPDDQPRVEVNAYLFIGDRAPIQLNGSPDVFHQINRSEGESPLNLSTAKHAEEYVRLFCAFVWGDDGAFRVVDLVDDVWSAPDDASGAMPAIEPPHVWKEGNDWLVDAVLAYGLNLFKARLKVSPSGEVEMLSDDPLGALGRNGVSYRKPTFSYPALDNTRRFVSFGPEAGWEELAPGEVLTRSIGQLRRAMTKREKKLVPDAGPNVWVELQGCECGTLDDNHGREWSDQIFVDLRGFIYRDLGEDRPATTAAEGMERAIRPDARQQITHGRELGLERLRWLTRVSSQTDFGLQPYEALTDALRRRGDVEAAEEVLFRKLAEETRRRSRLVRGIYLLGLEWPFRYGLSSKRASLVVVLYLLLGACAFDIANYGVLRALPVGSPRSVASGQGIQLLDRPMLVIDSQPVTVAVANSDDLGYRPVTLMATPLERLQEEVRCGDQVESLLYALDAMLPLLDLHQETKCSISSDNGATGFAWRIFRALYSIIGAYLTSMLVLTVSGVLRRKVDR